VHKLAACKRQVAHEHGTLRREADRFLVREFVVMLREVGSVRSGNRKRTKRDGKEGRTETSSFMREHVKPLDQISSELACHPLDEKSEDTGHRVKLTIHERRLPYVLCMKIWHAVTRAPHTAREKMTR
jgi:hypothetical protein